MNHNRGPWHAAKSANRQGLVVSESTGANIAVTYDKRDAAIVAAAPDLLDALQMLLKMTEDGDVTTVELNEARAAIAKAKGDL